MSKKNTGRFVLALITLIVLALGWKYSVLDWIVPAAILAGIAGVIILGNRFVCGHLCPRGAFLDVFVSKISKKKSAPAFVHGLPLKITVLAVFSAVFFFKLYMMSDYSQLPVLFWQMCLVTTLIGVALAFFINERAWCMICPVGTIEGLLRRKNKLLRVGGACASCGKCNKVCPTKIRPSGFKGGRITHLNCVFCGKCKTVCSVKVIK
ncbi:MAG: 4Fe-4S binding protein [Elusimicrobium sp.]|jgi:polyferredoxin|nr:4Fe-4S binding protein [Elusimicrobium sp.]